MISRTSPSANTRRVAAFLMKRTIPMVLPSVPFPFTGKINKLIIALDPPKLTPQDVKKLEVAGG